LSWYIEKVKRKTVTTDHPLRGILKYIDQLAAPRADRSER